MISTWMVYLICSLDSINTLINIILIPTGLVAFFSFIGCLYGYNEEVVKEDVFKFFKETFKFSLSLLIVFGLMETFIPSTNTAIAMYVIPKVVNSKTASSYVDVVNSLPPLLKGEINKRLTQLMEDKK